MRTRVLAASIIILLLTTACGTPLEPTPVALQPVRLQLQWLTQSQFAGYYVALDKGWYREEGIDLTIVPGGPDIAGVDEVLAGRSQFGTGLLADLVVAVQQDKPVVSLAQIQQLNGLLLVAKKSSGIATPQDFAGKRVGVWLGAWEAQFDALMVREGIAAQDFTLVSQGFSMDPLLNDELDVASAMIYNEYHILLESGLQPQDLTILDYADYGLDFPGDVLFTTRQMMDENSDLCVRMTRASLRGWRYAVDNPNEAVDIVLAYDKSGTLKREHEVSMMAEIAKLVSLPLRPVGYTDRDSVRRTIDSLLGYGILEASVKPEDVFSSDIWEQATKELK